jgi:hypothetical protein
MAVCKKCNLYETIDDLEFCNKCNEPIKKTHKPSWLDDSTPEKVEVSKKRNKSKKVKIENNKKDKINILKIVKPFLIIFTILAIIGGGVYLFNKFFSQESLTEGIIVNVVKKNPNSFGFGAKLIREQNGKRYNDTNLQTIFTVSCDQTIESAGNAFTINIATDDKAETTLITSTNNIKNCLEKKEAYISDGISFLKVSIIGNDENTSVAILLAPATLEKLAYNISQSQDNTSYVIKDNKIILLSKENINLIAEGSPIINNAGESKAVVVNNSEITIRELCSSLLSC